jgi:hypothetical protein
LSLQLREQALAQPQHPTKKSTQKGFLLLQGTFLFNRIIEGDDFMPRGDKSSYSPKQKRQAKHIEDSEKKSGKSTKTAERIAWATVNKKSGRAKNNISK